MKSKLKSIIKSSIPPSIIRQNINSSDAILLTFDDGPDPELTPRILDCLDQYNAKAIFFIPGFRIEKAPHLLCEILNRGHGIGNHSYEHITCNKLTYSEIVNDINKCKDKIFELTGLNTTLYRPPAGIITLSTLFAVQKCKHKIVRWSFDTGEYSYMKGRSSEDIANNFLSNIQAGEIVLSHDDHHSTLECLQKVLPVLRDRGFNFNSGLSAI